MLKKNSLTRKGSLSSTREIWHETRCTFLSALMLSGLLVFSVAIVKFASRGDDQFVIVGTVKDLILNPRSCSGGYLHVYQITNGGE